MSLALRLFVAMALIHLVFAVWPGLDIAVSRLFYDAEHGRFVGGDEAAEAVRHLIWNLSITLALAALAGWIAWSFLGRRARIPARLWAFPVLLYALGPGLLVNGLLKAYWGRARPAQVVEFGGDASFTPPFQITNECARNCSFVSGEGTAAVALALVVAVPLWPHLDRRGRLALALGLGALAVLGGGLRIAAGRHFLSDTVFGGFLVAFVALALFHVLRIGPARAALTLAGIRHDLHLMAIAIRQRLRRIAGG